MNHDHESIPGTPTPTPSRANGSGHGGESISDLIRSLATDLSALFGKEIELAKSEVRETVTVTKAAVGAIATGAAIAMAGLVILLLSAVYALSNMVAPWLAALIVGAAALLVGFLMVGAAKKKMSDNSIVPERTLESARKDKDTLKRATQ